MQGLVIVLMATAADYLSNSTWMHRMTVCFQQLDVDQDGLVGHDESEAWINAVDAEVKPDRPLVDKLLAMNEEFVIGMGIKKGEKVTLEQFLKGCSELAVGEVAKKRRGQPVLLNSLTSAWFDVIDTDHDGCVSLEEFRTMMKSMDFGASAADESFKVVDTNKNGKIEREELTDQMFKFWFTLDDKFTRGMFGERFEK